MKTVTAILAGGQSQRMGGRDKAVALFRGNRLIDCVVAALKPQSDALVISGRTDYGTGLTVVEDESAPAAGPAAGVYSVWKWLMREHPDAPGFFTAPVDCPIPPCDLIERLRSAGGGAVAADEDGVHPTFAYWPASRLESVFQSLKDQRSISLISLAAACDAAQVRWQGREGFANINTPADLLAADAGQPGK